MKKTTIVLLLVSFFLFYGDSARATSGTPGTPTLDPQANYTPQANDHRDTNERICQKFKPSKEAIANYLEGSIGQGTNTEGVQFGIQANVSNMPSGSNLNTYSAPSVFADGRNTMSRFTSENWTFVTANEYYWLCLTAPRGAGIWWYSDNPTIAQAGLYNYGFLLHGDTSEAAQDFGFRIFSSNMEYPQAPDPTPDPTPAVTTPATTTPAADNTPAASTPLPAGVTAGSGAAPAATSTSVKQATDLAVADVPADQGGAIKLDWKASATADIDGYKVFRSIEESKNFKEIAKTEKAILTYTDNSAVIGQKYYYMVRAYKTTKESASTSTLSATSIDNLAPAAPANFVFEASTDKITFIWDKNTEADFAGYTLTITNTADGKVVKTIDVTSDLSIYELIIKDVAEMTVDGKYEYALTAKDTHGNISEKSVAIAEKIVVTEAKDANSTDTKKDATPWLWYIIGVVVLGLAGFATYWFKFRKKPTINIT